MLEKTRVHNLREASVHLIAGGGVRSGFQIGSGLADKDVPFAGDGPDGLFGRSAVDSPGVAA